VSGVTAYEWAEGRQRRPRGFRPTVVVSCPLARYITWGRTRDAWFIPRGGGCRPYNTRRWPLSYMGWLTGPVSSTSSMSTAMERVTPAGSTSRVATRKPKPPW
jgi:hypothetical protein